MSNPLEKRFLTIEDLNNLPAPVWLVEGLFEANSLVMLAGPSYSFKSFLLLDWLCCMASGRNWNGKRTAPCKIGYALGEGKSSLLKRINAWIKYNQLTPEELARLTANFRITFEVPQLASKASVDNMLADLEDENYKPDVIAIDTFARSMVGMDENDAKDTGLWVEQADRLRQLGYGVLFLHHTKKNTEFGVQYRGSTAVIGAMDTAMTLVRDENYCTLTVTKQKDHDEGAPMRFRRVLVGAGTEEDSCVLVPAQSVREEVVEQVMQERFDILGIIDELLEDGSYDTNRARARELSKRTGMNESTANSKIDRREKAILSRNRPVSISVSVGK